MPLLSDADAVGEEGGMSKKQHILLVDDDRLVVATLKDGLSREGFEVSTAASGEEGIAVARDARPDLAIIDVRMPGTGGLGLARYLREHTRVPFLFLSAYSNEDIVRRAVDEGALGYLVKPLDATHLIPVIYATLARAKEIERLRELEAQLRTALAQGREASIAVGLLMERHRLDRDAAFELLRERARHERRKVNEVALTLIEASETLNRTTQRTSKASG